jgi:hypothetical protein
VPSDINPLFSALLGEFQRRNRAIALTSVTELRQVSSKQSVVLAWGAVQEPNFAEGSRTSSTECSSLTQT